MIIFHRISHLQSFAQKNPGLWKMSGFVPTMGALHQGHLSLVKTCKAQSSVVVVTIFVNPTQFNDPQDFEKYPVTLDKDIRMLAESGCDVLLLPSVKEMYPEGLQSKAAFALGSLETLLEGKYRPGHFQGVYRVMHKLLNIVRPQSLFMGEKDFQQCMVVQTLISRENLPVHLVICPTLREKDGLAMSSRNMRLSENERNKANAIYKEMQHIKTSVKDVPLRQLEENAAANLLLTGFESIDYVSIAHPATLEPLENWSPEVPAVVLVAAFLGGVRLIDNLRIS
jgi:pantoate--beta-alanine ligase